MGDTVLEGILPLNSSWVSRLGSDGKSEQGIDKKKSPTGVFFIKDKNKIVGVIYFKEDLLR